MPPEMTSKPKTADCEIRKLGATISDPAGFTGWIVTCYIDAEKFIYRLFESLEGALGFAHGFCDAKYAGGGCNCMPRQTTGK